ncbi:non-homologous end-joining DNA ligase [Jiangella gansuensis]|uniref:non-homologous end-joining DNA ligase n=1 Tax=Jiangella gansuensis TaxID=281473 RepID=UPI0004BC6794|nr:non-homologous end-joining DNA ligase [Jiangella gansuensis]
MTPDREELQEYRQKRSFDKTPEPRGGRARDRSGNRFVVQEHHARRLHWDLRLEHDGALASWALPRGFPESPDENRLAVHTEDHPLEYLTFEGDIPAGEYGAGSMTIWDQGTYEAEKFRDDKVVFRLDGDRVSGHFALFRTKGDDWMIHRMDPPADSGDPMPSSLTPMAATLSTLPPDQENWAFEIKWDGVRVVAYGEPGRLRLFGRNLREFTRQYPEIRPMMNDIGARRVVLDGELVAFDDSGKPSFQRLQPRIHLTSDADIRRQQRVSPVVYVIFDLLYLDGRSLLRLPYEERRRELSGLGLNGPNWQVPDYQRGDGDVLLDATSRQGLEGVVAKRLASRYQPGKRTRDWLKIKNVLSQEVVIGGWVPGQGRLSGRFGALLVGYHDDGALRFAGKVGTGFDDATRGLLQDHLDALRTDESPFTGRQPQKDAVFVQPELVCRVEFANWTETGTMRHPSFEGLIEDKPARDVVREKPAPPPPPEPEE